MRSGWLFFGRTFCLRTRFFLPVFRLRQPGSDVFLRMSRYFWISRRSGPLFGVFRRYRTFFLFFGWAGRSAEVFRLRQPGAFLWLFCSLTGFNCFSANASFAKLFSFHAVYLNSTAFYNRGRLRIHCRLLPPASFSPIFVLDLKILSTNRALHDLSLLFGF